MAQKVQPASVSDPRKQHNYQQSSRTTYFHESRPGRSLDRPLRNLPMIASDTRSGTKTNRIRGRAATATIPPIAPISVHGDTFAQAAGRFFVGRASQTAPVIAPARIKPATHISLALGTCHNTTPVNRHTTAITPTSGRLTSTLVESAFFSGGDVDIHRLCRDQPTPCQRVAEFAGYHRSSRRSSEWSSANSSSNSRDRSSSSFGTTI